MNCPACGGAMTYLDFLRQREFVRPLTLAQLADLRQNVQTVNCSNCGASVDLASESVCSHCGSALDARHEPHARGGRAADGCRSAAADRPGAAADPVARRAH